MGERVGLKCASNGVFFSPWSAHMWHLVKGTTRMRKSNGYPHDQSRGGYCQMPHTSHAREPFYDDTLSVVKTSVK